jgi:hypothetical protein
LPQLSDPSSHSWRQGVILPVDLPGLDIRQLVLDPQLKKEDILVLISQDCDICCRSTMDEPDVELLVGRRTMATVPVGNYSHGKNPRKLELLIESSDRQAVYSFAVHERQFISRTLLAESDREPNGKIGKNNLSVVRQWMARRYIRTALPTNFNTRTHEQRGRIEKKLRTLGNVVRSIHIRLGSQFELPDEELYAIDVVLLIDPKECPDPTSDPRVTELVDLFFEELESCRGIDLGKVESVLPSEITVEEVEELLRWEDPEYLSYQAGTPEALTARGI